MRLSERQQKNSAVAERSHVEQVRLDARLGFMTSSGHSQGCAVGAADITHLLLALLSESAPLPPLPGDPPPPLPVSSASDDDSEDVKPVSSVAGGSSSGSAMGRISPEVPGCIGSSAEVPTCKKQKV